MALGDPEGLFQPGWFCDPRLLGPAPCWFWHPEPQEVNLYIRDCDVLENGPGESSAPKQTSKGRPQHPTSHRSGGLHLLGGGIPSQHRSWLTFGRNPSPCWTFPGVPRPPRPHVRTRCHQPRSCHSCRGHIEPSRPRSGQRELSAASDNSSVTEQGQRLRDAAEGRELKEGERKSNQYII